MPIYAWAMLVFAAMIVFGFPAVILATALLELERAKVDDEIAAAESNGSPPVELQRRRAELTERIARAQS